MADLVPQMIHVSDGNPGALSVLAEVHREHLNLERMLSQLEQYNIRGHHIWIIYKQHCDRDIRQFECFPFEKYFILNVINHNPWTYSEL